MKISSWDVGIKNLAYCIIETTTSSDKPYIIHKWDIINIVQDDEIKCAWKDCQNKQIKQYCYLMGDPVYMCKDHKNYYRVVESKWNDIKANITNTDGSNICNCCSKKSKWCMNNSFYCTTHKTSLIKKWDKEIKNKTFTNSKVKSVPVEQLKLNLFLKLDAIPELLDVDDVCIENQPSFKNPRMKAISDSLFSWFLIRGKIDKERNGLTAIKRISFMSPSNKLKIEDHKDDIDKEISESSNKYKTTKALSIDHCKQILNYEPKYIEHLDKFKKKDDLCDVILMSIYYFKNLKKC